MQATVGRNTRDNPTTKPQKSRTATSVDHSVTDGGLGFARVGQMSDVASSKTPAVSDECGRGSHCRLGHPWAGLHLKRSYGASGVQAHAASRCSGAAAFRSRHRSRRAAWAGGPEVTMTYPSSVHARALALPGRTGDAEPKKPNSAPPIRAAAKPVLGPCRRPGRQRNDDLRSDTWMARSNSKPQSDRLLGARVWRQGIQRLLYRGRPAASRAGVLAHDLTAWPARRSRR